MLCRYGDQHKKEKNVKEFEIQSEFFKIVHGIKFLFKYPEARWIHAIPNGARVSIGQAVKLKRQGLVSGIADVFVPVPVRNHPPKGNNIDPTNYHGLYIEFKAERGKQSQAQFEFQNHCHFYDYQYVICRDAESAVKAVSTYLEPRHFRPKHKIYSVK